MLLSVRQALIFALLVPAASFSITGHPCTYSSCDNPRHPSPRLHLSAAADDTTLGSTTAEPGILSLKLEKPLGLLLEEVEEGADKGVRVQEIAEGGSAFDSEYKDKLTGLQVATVMGTSVLNVGFDTVMTAIMEAPSPVDIEFVYEGPVEADAVEATPNEPEFEVGTAVTINVMQEGKDDLSIEAKVGDNLRKILLENDVELYRGLKKKLGNCNGNGQCTFCAVDFVDSQGWAERSDYEDKKIGKWPRARLACLNNIQGPATIRIQ